MIRWNLSDMDMRKDMQKYDWEDFIADDIFFHAAKKKDWAYLDNVLFYLKDYPQQKLMAKEVFVFVAALKIRKEDVPEVEINREHEKLRRMIQQNGKQKKKRLFYWIYAIAGIFVLGCILIPFYYQMTMDNKTKIMAHFGEMNVEKGNVQLIIGDSQTLELEHECANIQLLDDKLSTIPPDKLVLTMNVDVKGQKSILFSGFNSIISSIKLYFRDELSKYKKVFQYDTSAPAKYLIHINNKLINKSISSATLSGSISSAVTNHLLTQYLYDNTLRIINEEEYEIQLMAIKYAFMSKRENTPGAEWNASDGYFTLPLSINQNFIMSDFRAMVVGGAHFDNSCFIKGTSSGIFVQDNEKVTRSFLEIVLDYLYVVKEQQFDVKMGKYLVAYYKVIYYLYGLKKIQKFNYFYLEMLYGNLSDIEKFIDENDLINQIEKADSENTQNINNNNSQTIDNSLMKDFVIQLKRIGESNYKFYETQKPAKKGQASNNNDNSKGGDVQEAQPVQDNSTATYTTTIKSDNSTCVEKMGDKISFDFDNNEMPVLLGSLIYDESWFKSTIDDE